MTPRPTLSSVLAAAGIFAGIFAAVSPAGASPGDVVECTAPAGWTVSYVETATATPDPTWTCVTLDVDVPTGVDDFAEQYDPTIDPPARPGHPAAAVEHAATGATVIEYGPTPTEVALAVLAQAGYPLAS